MQYNLEFEFIVEENGYRVVGFSGKPIDLVIEAVHNGKLVTSIGSGTFENCKSIKTVALPSCLENILDSAFAGCESLEIINCPKSLKLIDWRAFAYCKRLSNFVLEEGIRFIEESAFAYCSSLKEFRFPSSVEHIDEFAFEECSELSTFLVDENNKRYSSTNGILYDVSGNKLILCPPGISGEIKLPNNVFDIGHHSFLSCKKIISIVLPDSLKTIGEESFYGCTSIEKIAFPSGVVECGERAFKYCDKIKTIATTPNSKSLNEYIKCVANSSKRFENIVLEQNVTDVRPSVLNELHNLKTIIISENNKHLIFENNILYTKDKKQIVYVSKNITGSLVVPDSVETIVNDAIRNCVSIKEIYLPNSLKNINFDDLGSCSRLDKVVVTANNQCYSSFNGCVYSKYFDTFFFCPANYLDCVFLKDCTRSIFKNAFYYSKDLRSVTFGENIEHIGTLAFGKISYDTLSVTISYSGTMEHFYKIDVQDYFLENKIREVLCVDGRITKRKLNNVFNEIARIRR